MDSTLRASLRLSKITRSDFVATLNPGYAANPHRNVLIAFRHHYGYIDFIILMSVVDKALLVLVGPL